MNKKEKISYSILVVMLLSIIGLYGFQINKLEADNEQTTEALEAHQQENEGMREHIWLLNNENNQMSAWIERQFGEEQQND